VSAAPTRPPISQALVGGALVCATAVLCFRSGGFFHDPRTGMAIAAWVGVAVVAVLPAGPSLVPPAQVGRVALAGLLALAAWTALSLLWAPLLGSAREDALRLALYAAVLPLSVFAFRGRALVRALEVALAGLAAVVVGYGLLGDLGAIDVKASAGSDGRLDQPLTYWNAMGALAAFGLVLCVRIAADRTRPSTLRLASGIAAVPTAGALYLTYSRGALAAAALGLVVLALVIPEARPAWERAGHRWRVAAGWGAALAIAAALVFVAADRAAPPHRGATAERLADLGSNRADYWRVAARAFADAPPIGVGTAGFRVEWLRERDVREGASDAHSLYLETAAELGLVGLLALAAFVAATAVSAVRLTRRDPALVAGPCAALAMLAVHAGIDWDWELPALALPALMLAGAVIGDDRS